MLSRSYPQLQVLLSATEQLPHHTDTQLEIMLWVVQAGGLSGSGVVVPVNEAGGVGDQGRASEVVCRGV